MCYFNVNHLNQQCDIASRKDSIEENNRWLPVKVVVSSKSASMNESPLLGMRKLTPWGTWLLTSLGWGVTLRPIGVNQSETSMPITAKELAWQAVCWAIWLVFNMLVCDFTNYLAFTIPSWNVIFYANNVILKLNFKGPSGYQHK